MLKNAKQRLADTREQIAAAAGGLRHILMAIAALLTALLLVALAALVAISGPPQ